MFANRFVRSLPRMPLVARNMSAAPKAKGAAYREKTFVENWCMDVGAYPVMSVIVFAVVFATGSGIYIALSHPDARWTKASRSEIFRGELRGEK